MNNLLLLILLLAACIQAGAQETIYITRDNLQYYPESVNRSDEYINERCVLDLYYPEDLEGYPTVVWFHGGGLTGGNKEIPQSLKEKGLAVVAVNYRLYPKVKAPT